MTHYQGQTEQDRWVVEHVYPGKRSGFFVDVGAVHQPSGADSNTWVLEKELGWSGILVEPDPVNAALLRRLRKTMLCQVAAYDTDGETVELVMAGSFSGTLPDLGQDVWGPVRAGRPTVLVQTRTLATILRQHGAPRIIDFLSLDTEGSELRILRNFPFGDYTFGAVCVEHNFVSRQRQALRDLLTGNGYRFAGERGVDDCYVHPSIVPPDREVEPNKVLTPFDERQLAICRALAEHDRRRTGVP